jgi:hypothetical protein
VCFVVDDLATACRRLLRDGAGEVLALGPAPKQGRPAWMHDPEGTCSGSSRRHRPVDLPGTAVISVVLAAVREPLSQWPGVC